MAAEALDGMAQPRLSMVVFGLLAGLAGLWVYSATRDGGGGGAHRRRSSSGRGSGARTTLHRTQTIRRQRRQLSTSAIAEEVHEDAVEHNTAEPGGAVSQVTSVTAAAATRLAQEVAIETPELGQQHTPGNDAYESESADDASDGESDDTEADMRLMHLLCIVSDDQARRNGTIHRGTSCNSCQETPIRGMRYKCAQCANFDLCESCEAHEIHRHHILLRIAVPIPPLMNPRAPLIRGLYPGNRQPRELPQTRRIELVRTTCLDLVDIVSLYSEFCVLATVAEDGTEVITRDAFFKCLGQFGGARSVIASRLFAYYDADGDGVLTFDEMARGFSSYNKGTLDDKAPGIFRAYDVDGDGRVSRDDLRIMLEAFVDTNREITKNMVRTLEEDVLDEPSKLLPGQPLSAAFTAPIPTDSPSGLDKEISALRAEVLALRESAARRVSMLPVSADNSRDPGRAASDAGRAHSEESSSAASVAATTSATIGTIVSSRVPPRVSTSISLPDSVVSATPDTAAHAAAAAAVAAFTDTGRDEPSRPADTAIAQLAEDAAAGGRGAQLPALVPPTLWHDLGEDGDWPVMEALSQDAIRLMIEEIFTEAAPKDPICMTCSEFVEYLQRNPSLASYLEVLGTIF
ncbi:hypothetical protein LPJ61_003670 [Coemansia biformis]|uniref:EF-hand n=1 Tax=Coemansia biformis TaxID=1286918 RepID=A0A9W8CW23_9FUNG|nr:hypothetical protein LPJ61_003670 [Coemansia biformis]